MRETVAGEKWRREGQERDQKRRQGKGVVMVVVVVYREKDIENSIAESVVATNRKRR